MRHFQHRSVRRPAALLRHQLLQDVGLTGRAGATAATSGSGHSSPTTLCRTAGRTPAITRRRLPKSLGNQIRDEAGLEPVKPISRASSV